MPDTEQDKDWTCGGWEEAAMNTLRHGAALTLYEKLLKIEELEEIFLNMQHGRSTYPRHADSPGQQAAEDPPSIP